MSALLLLTAADAALAALRPWPGKLIVDDVLTRKALPASVAWLSQLPGVHSAGRGSHGALLAWLAGFTILLFLAGQAISAVQSQLSTVVGRRMQFALSIRVFNQLQRLSLRFHGRRKVGDLIRRIANDTTCAKDLVIGVGLAQISTIIRFIIMFVVIWRLDRTLSLVVLGARNTIGPDQPVLQ